MLLTSVNPQPLEQAWLSTQLPANPQSRAEITVVGQKPQRLFARSTRQSKPEFAVRGFVMSPSRYTVAITVVTISFLTNIAPCSASIAASRSPSIGRARIAGTGPSKKKSLGPVGQTKLSRRRRGKQGRRTVVLHQSTFVVNKTMTARASHHQRPWHLIPDEERGKMANPGIFTLSCLSTISNLEPFARRPPKHIVCMLVPDTRWLLLLRG